MLARVAGRPVRLDPRAGWTAVRLDLGRQSRAARAWLAFLLVLVMIGACGAVASLVPGKEVFGTGPVVEWGVLIAAYVFFAVTTSGLCLASSLGTVFGIEMFMPLEKRHAILAVLSLVTAFGIIALDLHYPVRLVFGVVLSPSPLSPMWWMGVLYGIYLCFLLTEVWSMFTGHPRLHRAACVAASIMAVVAPTTLGAVFGVLASRPYWYGSFTPPSLLVSALLAGTALLGIAFGLVHRFRLRGFGRGTDMAIPAIRLLLTIVLCVAIFLTAWQTIVGLYAGVPGLFEATAALMVGPLSLQFWVLRVLLGLVVPLALLVLPRTRTPAGLFATSCLVFAGVFVDRVIFVAAGQVAPGTAASGIVSRPYAEYSPSLVEISIVVGALGFIALGYSLAERYLDLGSYSGHAVAWLGVPAEAPTVAPVRTGRARARVNVPVRARTHVTRTTASLSTAHGRPRTRGPLDGRSGSVE